MMLFGFEKIKQIVPACFLVQDVDRRLWVKLRSYFFIDVILDVNDTLHALVRRNFDLWVFDNCECLPCPRILDLNIVTQVANQGAVLNFSLF